MVRLSNVLTYQSLGVLSDLPVLNNSQLGSSSHIKTNKRMAQRSFHLDHDVATQQERLVLDGHINRKPSRSVGGFPEEDDVGRPPGRQYGILFIVKELGSDQLVVDARHGTELGNRPAFDPIRTMKAANAQA